MTVNASRSALARDRVRSARKIYDCCTAGRGQARSYTLVTARQCRDFP